MNIETLWNSFLKKIRNEISHLSYDTWFKDSKLYKIENDTATIIVPTIVHKKHLEEIYLDDIIDVFTSITNLKFNFKFVLEDEIEDTKKVINIDEFKQRIPYTNLNYRFTFDNFIVCNSNRFAYTVAKEVAKKPGKAYKSLFLYGKSGVGKTHLLHAIGNYIKQNTNNKVLYVSSKNFANDCYNVFKNNNDNDFEEICSFKNFKKKYNDIDVLIIDDIQFLGDYDIKVQEYFFNIFNELYNYNKQIIMASDRSVDDLTMIETRLITRFYWGITANIILPDFDLESEKENKVQKKTTEDISMEVIEHILNITDSYARQLNCVVETLKDMKSGNMNRNYTPAKKRSDNVNKNYKTEKKDNVNKNYAIEPKKNRGSLSWYVVEYLNENEFRKKERAIKQYNMLAYKKLIFDIIPTLRRGNFHGKMVFKDDKEGFLKYECKLPTDRVFVEKYGTIKLHYTVYENQKIVMLDTITPESILSKGSKKELPTYKGVMLSKIGREKDMFKINLLNKMSKND